MKVRFIGDIHGEANGFALLNEPTIYVGDFNLFGYDKWFKWERVFKKIYPVEVSVEELVKVPTFFVDGNHDNFPILDTNSDQIIEVANNIHYIPRGFLSGKVLFIGGADSIDRDLRTAGRDWFPEERLSQLQFEKIMTIDPSQVEVIVTHDAPLSYISSEMRVFQMPTQIAFEHIFDHFKPKLWVHGHYHMSINKEFKGCRFVGLDCNEAVDIDVPIADDFFSSKKKDVLEQ